MKIRASQQDDEIHAYIVTSFDEHQNHIEDDAEGRLEFISGFSGPVGDAVVGFLWRVLNKKYFSRFYA